MSGPRPPCRLAAEAPSRPPLPGADRDADPALWVVRDADTTIYLFGTIHLLDGRTWFNDEVRTAFDASRELVLEARLPEDPASLQTMIMRYALDPQGRTLSSRLTPAQNAALNRALGSIGVPPGAFDRLEPWFVSLTLSAVLVQQLGLSADNGPETILTRAAQARHIPIGELEGMEYQIRLFDGMPAALQLAQLTQTLDELDHVREKFEPLLSRLVDGQCRAAVRRHRRGGRRHARTTARCTGSSSPTATPPGQPGSSSASPSRARCSSRSARPISPAATASRPCLRGAGHPERPRAARGGAVG